MFTLNSYKLQRDNFQGTKQFFEFSTTYFHCREITISLNRTISYGLLDNLNSMC
ncbi:hypothetical protein KsCSTR_07050 [Candidatus Kuenenia stuttgartiensis]|uniref:Uncharacterized protein n=1 Tax=Kuenenia stuttgartiensis TaxID=174633 RepID=Q1PZN5_KUEST|nr:hypothetical protein KsCSTR_07050 [Candidatus Kuenenia stuttgartiensis]CAJ72538.1 unknown protein [Candidatus Kuenenia stuttgartiensis]